MERRSFASIVDLSCLFLTLSSPKGRGSRAAGWFDDLVKDRNVEGISSIILEDDGAGWANAGKDYTSLMEEYNASAWASQK
jgi:arsenical-resistance protein 2